MSERATEPAILWSTDIWSPPYALLRLAFLVSISSHSCNATFVLQNAIVQKTQNKVSITPYFIPAPRLNLCVGYLFDRPCS